MSLNDSTDVRAAMATHWAVRERERREEEEEEEEEKG